MLLRPHLHPRLIARHNAQREKLGRGKVAGRAETCYRPVLLLLLLLTGERVSLCQPAICANGVDEVLGYCLLFTVCDMYISAAHPVVTAAR